MERPLCVLVLCLAAAAPATALRAAGHACDICGRPCSQPATKTVMVPVVVTETRMKSCLVTKTEQRECKYTVFERVPVEKQYFKEQCYLEDDVKTKTITKQICKVVDNPASVTCKVHVPVTEYQHGIRERDVCGDGSLIIEEPYVCELTREKTALETFMAERPQVVFEKSEYQIDYCVKVPKTEREPCCEETVYELRPIEKTKTVEVEVPEYIKKPVEVQVTKMFPKHVSCCSQCARVDLTSHAAPLSRGVARRGARDEGHLEKLASHLTEAHEGMQAHLAKQRQRIEQHFQRHEHRQIKRQQERREAQQAAQGCQNCQ